MGAIFTFLGMRGSIAAGLFLALLASLGLLHMEHKAKVKAQERAELMETAASISQQQILLYQNREEIKSRHAKKRGQIDDWQKKGDLDSLVTDFNAPGGVRGKLPANPQRGIKTAPGQYRAQGTGETYQEAP